ncbi:DUF885 family protein [Mycoplasma enhydrae]|uniref:DUF885 family protein n=1 Tax=Mycoplasma enhydrae TaxID=2499220 RepID=UPI0021E963D3|nr:DUF885 family protein [Mycoplasma enhydrae]MCV3753247.1 DUF885 family protein [Mycoplasma enhydrae]
MTPKTKKALLISGITLGGVAVVAGLPLMAWGIQQGIYNKTRGYVKDFENKEDEVKDKFKSQSEDINNKSDELNQLKDQYKDVAKEKGETSAEAKAIADNIKVKEKALAEAKDKYQFEVDKELFPFLRKIAEKGNPNANPKVKDLTAKYVLASYRKFQLDAAKKQTEADFEFPSKEDVKKIVAFYDEYIQQFSAINKANLDVTSTAWVSGLKYEWEIAKTVYNSHSRLIGAYLGWGLAYSYPANAFYETINLIKGDQAEKVHNNLKEGIELGVVLSKVVIKMNIASILARQYATELKTFVNGSDSEKTVLSIIEGSAMDAKTKAFHKFYVSEYYAASKHGAGEDIAELKVYKTNDSIKEVENTIEILDSGTTKKVYGLGLTEKDLNAKNVGIGHMPAKKDDLTYGKKLYDSILKTSTTSNDSAQTVYNSGYKTASVAKENMQKIADKVAELITGKKNGWWNPQVTYDEDGLGSKEATKTRLLIRKETGKADLDNFNKWLNQEKFFFGREDSTYYSTEKKGELDSDANLKNARKILKDKGYETQLKGKNDKHGSITKDQYYYGALEAFKGYYQFRDTTIEEGYSYFANQVPKYGITTYDKSRSSVAGVGAYNSSEHVGDGTTGAFVFNADPYYSLPKWSVTSFANHESVMGHHNQIYYAKEFLKTINGETIGDIFDYTSYVEGWALFAEWFGIEAGLYGTPDFENEDYYALPLDFKKSKGITNFVKAEKAEDVTNEEIEQIKKLHGGVYWELIATEQDMDDKERTLKAVELANMLQYYGALNEAQLRNMRRAIDPAYHGDLDKPLAGLPAGASISDVRKYMKANSALGIGDITSESKRYLNLPGQATSYNSGKELMLELYDRVRKHKELSRKDFIGDKKNIQELFNVFLETGALPLETLKEVVEKYYEL